MVCLNSINGPLCYYETNNIAEMGKVIEFKNAKEVDTFIALAAKQGISESFFDESYIVDTAEFSSFAETINWRDIPVKELFIRPEVD